MQQNLSKILYNDQGESISITTKFNLKKLFFDLPIFTNKKNPIIEQQLLKMQNKLKPNQEHYPNNNT